MGKVKFKKDKDHENELHELSEEFEKKIMKAVKAAGYDEYMMQLTIGVKTRDVAAGVSAFSKTEGMSDIDVTGVLAKSFVSYLNDNPLLVFMVTEMLKNEMEDI